MSDRETKHAACSLICQASGVRQMQDSLALLPVEGDYIAPAVNGLRDFRNQIQHFVLRFKARTERVVEARNQAFTRHLVFWVAVLHCVSPFIWRVCSGILKAVAAHDVLQLVSGVAVRPLLEQGKRSVALWMGLHGLPRGAPC